MYIESSVLKAKEVNKNNSDRVHKLIRSIEVYNSYRQKTYGLKERDQE
jgi:hypothetical protein